MSIRISYAGNDIDLLVDDGGLTPNQKQSGSRNRSGAGNIETVNFHGIEELVFYAIFDEEKYRQLYTWWWSWARFGNFFSFTMDHTKTVTTILDGATSGATIPLATTTGLSVGDELLIMAAGDNEREIIVIDSISAGVSIDADASLVNTFASGAIARHKDYYPSLLTIDNSFRPEKNGATYKNAFRWIEKIDFAVGGGIMGDGDRAILG